MKYELKPEAIADLLTFVREMAAGAGDCKCDEDEMHMLAAEILRRHGLSDRATGGEVQAMKRPGKG